MSKLSPTAADLEQAIIERRKAAAKAAAKAAKTSRGKPKPKKAVDRPTKEQIKSEIRRQKAKKRFRHFLRNTAYVILTVSAVAVLVSTFVLPVMKVYGNSMSPTVDSDEVVVCFKQRSYSAGDIVALYYNNRIIIRRIICTEGERFDIDADGNVFINDMYLDEPYLTEKSYDTTDIDLPFTVGTAQYFLLADNRASALDSRTNAVGTVTADQIAGRVLLSIWPLRTIRIIN